MLKFLAPGISGGKRCRCYTLIFYIYPIQSERFAEEQKKDMKAENFYDITLDYIKSPAGMKNILEMNHFNKVRSEYR